MGVVEEATRRLEQLARAGVSVPWGAAGLEQSNVKARVESVARGAPVAAVAGGVVRHATFAAVTPELARARAGHPKSAGHRTATVDLERLEASGHLVPTAARSPLAEEFRHIKQPLLSHAKRQDASSPRAGFFVVTSALPGEGKTFCALNLAMSIAAEIDTSVLLVDTDALRSELLQRLGISAQQGLFDLLADPHMELADVMLRTNVPKLSVLPAGKSHTSSSELLASEAMERLLVELTADDAERVVIFDTPPLLLVNDAQVLASRVGQALLVVEAESTPRARVTEALEALTSCPRVMTILNKSRRRPRPAAYEGEGSR